MSTRISEQVARPVRTAVQAAPAAAVTEFIDVFVYDMNDRQYAALVVGLTLAIGYVQTAIEQYKGKAFLRNVNVETVPAASETPEVKADEKADAAAELPDIENASPVDREDDPGYEDVPGDEDGPGYR